MYGAGARLRNGAGNQDTARRTSFSQQMTGGGPFDTSRPIGVPVGHDSSGNAHQQRMATAAPFAGRSPTNKQNTSHVPCKFFRQGQCQAGKTCPFSHDLATSVDVTCKYFSKGNCKFGPKCANVHILPDGRRVNYGRSGPVMSGGPLNLGGRLNPEQYNYTSNLTDSLYQAQPMPPAVYHQFDHFQAATILHDMPRMTLDDTYTSGQQAFAHDTQDSAPRNFPNVLEVQLPASFDNNGGIPWSARQGPVSASVPRDFGIAPIPQSVSDFVNGHKDSRTSEVLKTLYSSAYNDDTRDRFNGVATSPPLNAYVKDEELYAKRTMHSQRAPKSSIMSASLPQSGADADWDSHFTFEEDYIPNELSHLLTAQEKARRMSKNGDDVLSTSATPETSSRHASPSNASPSGWTFRQRQQREEEVTSGRASDFALVGSPLRNSSVPGGPIGIRTTTRPLSGAFDQSPWIASPPRNPSLLSGLFAKSTHLNASTVPDVGSSSNVRSAPIGTARKVDLDRTTSSSSVTNHRSTSPIDEEHGDDFVFSMDEEVKEAGDSKETEPEVKAKSEAQPYITSERGTQVGDATDDGPPGTSLAVISNQGRTFRMLDGNS